MKENEVPRWRKSSGSLSGRCGMWHCDWENRVSPCWGRDGKSKEKILLIFTTAWTEDTEKMEPSDVPENFSEVHGNKERQRMQIWMWDSLTGGCGGLTLAGGLLPTSCSFTTPAWWDRGENKVVKLLSWDKDVEIACQLLSQAKQARLGEDGKVGVAEVYCQFKKIWFLTSRQKVKHLFPLFFFLRLSVTPLHLTSVLSSSLEGWGIEVMIICS